jgi:hypothetical protein
MELQIFPALEEDWKALPSALRTSSMSGVADWALLKAYWE